MDVLHRRPAGDPRAVLRALLPELPRWLAVHGRAAEAEAALSLIERETEKSTGEPLPPPQPVMATSDQRASLSDLFGETYLRRTLVVWVIWFAAYFVNYGLAIWLPTIYRTVFKLPLDVSLRYGLITQAVGLLGTFICALTIDYVGRRIWFAIAFACAAVSLGVLAITANPTAEQVLTHIDASPTSLSAPSTSASISTRRSFIRRGRARSASAPRPRGCASPR